MVEMQEEREGKGGERREGKKEGGGKVNCNYLIQ